MNRKFQYLITLKIDDAIMYRGKYNTYIEILESFPEFSNIENIRKHCHNCHKNVYKKKYSSRQTVQPCNHIKITFRRSITRTAQCGKP